MNIVKGGLKKIKMHCASINGITIVHGATKNRIFESLIVYVLDAETF